MRTNRRKPSLALTKIMASISSEDRRRARDRMLIAVKIADALEAKRLSNKAFAKLMGKSESEVSEWLSGNRNFTVDTLSDISDCLGIRLLPVSDMRAHRVSFVEMHKKVTGSLSPSTYSMVGNNRLNSVSCEWSVLGNNVFAIA